MPTSLTSEARATMRANLELELTARKDKLLSMCEAQVASLRSRLERRVNRIPMSKRSANIMELIAPKLVKPATAPVKEPAINPKRARPVARPAPSRAASTRTAATSTHPSRPAQPSQKAHPPQNILVSPQHEQEPTVPSRSRNHTHPAQPNQSQKQPATRAVKRSSNEMASDKENMADQLSVPKKRAKLPVNQKAPAPRNPRTNAADPAPARTTRAASRKLAAPEVLSPKSSNARTNSRTVAPARTTRRAR